jgi:hypothetical protein
VAGATLTARRERARIVEGSDTLVEVPGGQASPEKGE